MAVVEVSDANAVRTITLNRPDRLNALGREVREVLEVAVADTLEADVRIVVIRGAGRAFSAGADLKDPDVPEAEGGLQRRRRSAGRWGRLLDAIESLPQVTVAAVHGPVVGGAVLVSSACDLRVAAQDAFFVIPELALGIPLTWGGIPRLVREIGLPRAREMVLTGRSVPADEAHGWGLVHRVGELDAELDRLVAELLAMPDAPLAQTKEALRASGRTLVSLETGWADPDLLDAARRDPESTKAASAYLERLAQRRERS